MKVLAKNTTSANDAEKEIKSHLSDINHVLKVLDKEINKRFGKLEFPNWAHESELAYMKSKLQGVLAFVRGTQV